MDVTGMLTRRWGRLVGGVLVAVPLVLVGAPPTQGAPPPTATQIRVVAVGSPGIDVPQTAGSPDSFVAVGYDVTVDVVLEGVVDGQVVPLPASYNKDTTLTVAVAQGATSLEQSATTSVVVPAGETSAAFTGVRFTAAANGVRLEVSGPPPKNKNDPGLAPGLSGTMDVQSEVVTAPAGSTRTSIGPSSDEGCVATPAQPVCADLLLPNGSAGPQLLSLGLCDGAGTATDCPTDRSVVQALADLQGMGYDRGHPATLVMKCDKTSCGGGALWRTQLNVSLSATGPLTAAPACPAKGTIGDDQAYCVDYVQSTRDNAGDTFLYLLLFEDARATFH